MDHRRRRAWLCRWCLSGGRAVGVGGEHTRTVVAAKMTRLAAVLALLCSPVAAQDFPTPVEYMNTDLLDRFDLVRVTDDRYRLTYLNHASQNSRPNPDPVFLDDGGRVDLRLTLGGEELLQVTPPDGWFADPWEISVADGDSGEVVIFRLAPGF